MNAYSDPQAVSRYAENPPRLVPGYADLQRMALVLLAEHAPVDGRIFVLGAGGGLELKVFAEARPEWTFVGVDPSPEMLGLARRTLGELQARVEFHEGYIDGAPGGPYDGAACILTLHFIERQERLRTLREVRRRLRPGAPFVAAHYSIASDESDLWLARAANFWKLSGIDPARAETTRAGIAARLPILAPEEDERLLTEAGFSSIRLFYMGLAFRGWVAYA